MTEDELSMKVKLRNFNFTDEEIIIKTREAREACVIHEANAIRLGGEARKQQKSETDSAEAGMGCAIALSIVPIIVIFLVSSIYIKITDSLNATHEEFAQEEARKIEVKKQNRKSHRDFLVRTFGVYEANAIEREERKSPEERSNDAWNDAVKSRDKFDNLLRNNVSNRKEDLEKKAVSHKRYNTAGSVMADSYTMGDGSSVVCYTKVSPNGPATMECN